MNELLDKRFLEWKKSEKYWGQRQNGWEWAGAVMVGRGGK